MPIFRGKISILALAVFPWLSIAICTGKADSCSRGEDLTSLIQIKGTLDLGTERLAKQDPTKIMVPMEIPGSEDIGPTMALVDTPRGGYLPGLSSRAKCFATVNLAKYAQSLKLPGDFVETGVYYGATSIMMAQVLQQDQDNTRQLWSADSFAGLPNEDAGFAAREKVPDPSKDTGAAPTRFGHAGTYPADRDTFEMNLKANGLGTNASFNPQIHVLQGFFSDTLPTAPIKQISFLRLDGDIYVSTMDSLKNLYDKVVPGGLVYIDDYGTYIGCNQAVDEFRKMHNITEPMHPVSECGGCSPPQYDAIWWRKSGGAVAPGLLEQEPPTSDPVEELDPMDM